MFDTHAHYDARQFDPDRDQVLSALPGQGVELVVDPGCDLASSRKAVELAGRWPFVYAAVGVHPEDCGDWKVHLPLLSNPETMHINALRSPKLTTLVAALAL
ncbi:MAG: hydrolase TatD, partial [Oscillospiraceae bacterium]|nr:hydrolase TatD [Oscillospiraceae bacterium]